LPELDARHGPTGRRQAQHRGKAIVEMHPGSAAPGAIVAAGGLLRSGRLRPDIRDSKPLARAQRVGSTVAKRDNCAREQ
jgi:hypothetical protein